MDLYAYKQIDELSQIAKENNIEIPRLRGYRLMKNEEPITSEEFNTLVKDSEIYICKLLCESIPKFTANAYAYTYDEFTDSDKRKYFIVKKDVQENIEELIGIRWDKIHGKKRKVLKFEIKKQKKRIKEQYDMWNKYAGRSDVLYIHSRIGGNNWNFYNGDELKKQPWFLDKVDDYLDDTYCDIYALIK